MDGVQIQLDTRRQCFEISCRTGWAALFPQSAHLLREEVLAWQKTPWSICFVED
jgi:exopolyphosphatase/guanosine-5'-triphosphate,3'-diphosphate pyrophosphatase